MSITIRLPDGKNVATEVEPIWVGSDTTCTVCLSADGRVQSRHAKLRRTAGRWLVESLGEWPLQVGSGSPSRLSWLKPGDVIRLSPSGPDLVFQPTTSPEAKASSSEPELYLDDEPFREGSQPSIPSQVRQGPPPLPGSTSPPRKGPPPLPK